MIRYSEQIPLAGLTEHSKPVDNKIFSETNYGKEHIKIKCHKLWIICNTLPHKENIQH